MLAVLSDAIEQFQKHVHSKDERGKKLFREVEEWFLEKDGDCLFSFEYICETLELHTDYIRQGLMSSRRRGVRSILFRGVVGVKRKPVSHTLHSDVPKLHNFAPLMV
jgi:hypothetical protein